MTIVGQPAQRAGKFIRSFVVRRIINVWVGIQVNKEDNSHNPTNYKEIIGRKKLLVLTKFKLVLKLMPFFLCFYIWRLP